MIINQYLCLCQLAVCYGVTTVGAAGMGSPEAHSRFETQTSRGGYA